MVWCEKFFKEISIKTDIKKTMTSNPAFVLARNVQTTLPFRWNCRKTFERLCGRLWGINFKDFVKFAEQNYPKSPQHVIHQMDQYKRKYLETIIISHYSIVSGIPIMFCFTNRNAGASYFPGIGILVYLCQTSSTTHIDEVLNHEYIHAIQNWLFFEKDYAKYFAGYTKITKKSPDGKWVGTSFDGYCYLVRHEIPAYLLTGTERSPGCYQLYGATDDELKKEFSKDLNNLFLLISLRQATHWVLFKTNDGFIQEYCAQLLVTPEISQFLSWLCKKHPKFRQQQLDFTLTNQSYPGYTAFWKSGIIR